MITLITGTPGAGKTAWTVQELTRLPAQRKVYIHGIPELKLAHEPIYCKSDLCDLCAGIETDEHSLFVENWPQWATDGSLIVIDEVQRIWRPSNSSAKLPDDISRLETHRHRGLDFWLISQGPHLFHSNIRLLIGRHIHLVAKWNGRSEYEWPECRQNVTSRSDAVTRPYTLPSKIFHLYKSSSLHVKQVHRKPLAFYGFFAALVLLVVMIYFSYQRVTAHLELTPVADAQTAKAVGVAATGDTGYIPPPAETSKLKFPDFKPTIEGVPESAPAYMPLVQVKAAPRLMGCIKTVKDCKCYTNQATPYPTSLEFCAEYIRGNYFNPYKSPTQDLQISDNSQKNSTAKPVPNS